MTVNESPNLAAIKQKYRLSLTQKADFVFQWAETQKHTRDEFVELASWLHKFAGSAGMYGYDSLSAMARSLMLEAEAVLEQNEPTSLSVCYATKADSMKGNIRQLGELMCHSALN